MTTRNPLDNKLWSGDSAAAVDLAVVLAKRFPLKFTAYLVEPGTHVVCADINTSMEISLWIDYSERVRSWVALHELNRRRNI